MRIAVATVLVMLVATAGCDDPIPPEYVTNSPVQRKALGMPERSWTSEPFSVVVGDLQLRIPAWIVHTVESYDRPLIPGQANAVWVSTEWPEPRPFTANPSDRPPRPVEQILIELRENQPSNSQSRKEILAAGDRQSSTVDTDFNGTGMVLLQRQGWSHMGFDLLAPAMVVSPTGDPVVAHCRTILGNANLDLCFVSIWFRNSSVRIRYMFRRKWADRLPEVHAHVLSVLDEIVINRSGGHGG